LIDLVGDAVHVRVAATPEEGLDPEARPDARGLCGSVAL
jgi:hypothetical protein